MTKSSFSTILGLSIRIFKKVRFEFRVSTGIGMHEKGPHRLPMERNIFPFFVSDNHYRTVLFVGCSLATIWYKKVFKDMEYWTLDIDHRKKRMGAKNHIVDRLSNLNTYFDRPYFNLIFVNGVIGWGLDDPQEADVSVNACYNALKPNGKFIIGWNDIPERKPFEVDTLKALRQFERWNFPPVGRWRHLIPEPTPYYYDFYVKIGDRNRMSEQSRFKDLKI